MTALHGSLAIAAPSSGKATLLIVSAVIAVIVLVFRLKYAPPWWLRRHRENTRQSRQSDGVKQPPSDRTHRDQDDASHDAPVDHADGGTNGAKSTG